MVLLIMMISSNSSYGQGKETEYREQTWLGFFNQTRFTKHSGLWLDLHFRLTENFIQEKSLSIARVGYTYYVGEAKITAGYAYATRYAHAANQPNEPEHRGWQQVQWVDKKKDFTMMQWIRLEERFRDKIEDGWLTGDYRFNYRARYNLALTVPLKGKQVQAKTPFLFFNNEVHVNFGKEINVNFFDQNRMFAGLGYQFTSHLNAHLGYMLVFQQLPEVNRFVHINTIRLFVFHNIDRRNH
jgi:hypothetical protein